MRIVGPGESIERAAGGVTTLPRYERPVESPCDSPDLTNIDVVPFTGCEAAIAGSALSPGARQLLCGLLRVGTTRDFPGGGVGIEYGSLLKTAARPDFLAGHIAEAAAHLRACNADLLVVPGMSGYPIGAMYAIVSGLPAILLKKTRLEGNPVGAFPAGSFIIPSYTGDGDVVMSADREAAQDIVDTIITAQLAAQADRAAPSLSLRLAGADDIIDKATMSQAVGESALVIGRAAIDDFIRRHRLATGDERPIDHRVELVAWVTPLIKGYNGPHAHLARSFGITPFAGLNITSVHLTPAAIGIEGVGILSFARAGQSAAVS